MDLLSDCVSACVSMQSWNFFSSLMFLQAAAQKLTEWTDIVQNRYRTKYRTYRYFSSNKID